MASPWPVPLPTSLVVKNGSKIFARAASGMPVPVSVFLQLASTGDVGRVVWFVPNRTLRRQVRKELAAIGVHLDADTVTQRRDRDGVILTYHVLSDPAKLQQIVRDAAETPTLFVLDEVHHLAIDKEGKAGRSEEHTSEL